MGEAQEIAAFINTSAGPPARPAPGPFVPLCGHNSFVSVAVSNSTHAVHAADYGPWPQSYYYPRPGTSSVWRFYCRRPKRLRRVTARFGRIWLKHCCTALGCYPGTVLDFHRARTDDSDDNSSAQFIAHRKSTLQHSLPRRKIIAHCHGFY